MWRSSRHPITWLTDENIKRAVADIEEELEERVKVV